MLVRVILVMCTLFAPFVARAEVVVFSAASLKEPIDALAQKFGDVSVSYAGSGTLARQVSLGAPADVVLLANVAWMDALVEERHVQPESVFNFASNALVLIGPSDAPDIMLEQQEILNVLGEGRLAIGFTKAVPAGIYGFASLKTLGMDVLLGSRLAEVDSVRGVLALVARGQAPLGIVYETDALVSDDVRVVARFPEQSHPPIRYTGALTQHANEDAAAFLAFVAGAQGQQVFADLGFLPASVNDD